MDEREWLAERFEEHRPRRRVQGEHTIPNADLDAQREVVEAFLRAAREGDFEGLLEVLDPDVVLRADAGPVPGGSTEVRGAAEVAGRAAAYSRAGLVMRPVLVNGAVGVLSLRDGEPFPIAGFTVSDGKIVALDILADPERVRRLDLTFLDG